MGPGRSLLAVVVGVVAGVAPVSGAGAPPVVRPGGIVRWAAQGVEACALGERRWQPLEGECYFPLDLQAVPGPRVLTLWHQGELETRTVMVGAPPYPVERISLPDDRMVHLSPADLARVLREQQQLKPLWASEGPRQFALPLHRPLSRRAKGRNFGSKRIINGEARSPHSGLDFHARRGDPVLAVGRGTVAASHDLFFGGQSVFIDHGDGLISMYMHLSRVSVEVGQRVERGQKVGAVGSTGRATGPHLHFGLRWHGARADPTLLFGAPNAIPEIR